MNKFELNNEFLHTYHIPYGIRQEICNLLDADQSWRTLGGQFFNLNITQLTLLGQAHMRNASPTEELLNKLDSANVKIDSLCSWLKQMQHYRALEILKPILDASNYSQQVASMSRDDSMLISKGTLATPTPSFDRLPGQQPQALMFNDFGQDLMMPSLGQFNYAAKFEAADNDYQQQAAADAQVNNTQNTPSKCHKSRQTEANQQTVASNDPGEEIVRMACANNRKRTSISDQEVVNQLRLIMQITYNELKQASDNFSDSNILGNGGFASVYRGNWKGTDVAIKRLKCNLMDQALNELTILNSYRIDNILPIYGISIDGPEACLVYQFMSNGSLEDRLSCKLKTPPLTWSQRAMIGEGVAKGLYYLHTLRDKPLVHGDVKSANVLLDSQFVPKLGDFGLARQVFKGKNPQTELCTHCTVSSIHGTSVYLPPEYLRHKILSPAVDVYSYGIVLLEMATGKRAYDGKRLLIDLVEDETKSIMRGEISYSLKDSRLANDSQSDLKIWYELLIRMGLQCAHKIKKKRLEMGQVLSRFAEFRGGASSTNHGNQAANMNNLAILPNNNNNNLLNNHHDNSTTRTLTPDLTAFSNNQHPLRPQYQQNAKGPPIQENSSLMIVEEELGDCNEAVASRTQDNEVEAMIPLLTELGVVAED